MNCTYSETIHNFVVGSGPNSLTKICVPSCSVMGNNTINSTARYCNRCASDKKVNYGECISKS